MPRFCSGCGRILADDAAFCHVCGRPVRRTEEMPQQTVPPLVPAPPRPQLSVLQSPPEPIVWVWIGCIAIILLVAAGFAWLQNRPLFRSSSLMAAAASAPSGGSSVIQVVHRSKSTPDPTPTPAEQPSLGEKSPTPSPTPQPATPRPTTADDITASQIASYLNMISGAAKAQFAANDKMSAAIEQVKGHPAFEGMVAMESIINQHAGDSYEILRNVESYNCPPACANLRELFLRALDNQQMSLRRLADLSRSFRDNPSMITDKTLSEQDRHIGLMLGQLKENGKQAFDEWDRLRNLDPRIAQQVRDNIR